MIIRLLNPQHWNLVGADPLQAALTPLVSIQNLDPKKGQEVSERGLASFSVLKKNKLRHEGEMV